LALRGADFGEAPFLVVAFLAAGFLAAAFLAAAFLAAVVFAVAFLAAGFLAGAPLPLSVKSIVSIMLYNHHLSGMDHINILKSNPLIHETCSNRI
jgi:hypothetical protein